MQQLRVEKKPPQEEPGAVFTKTYLLVTLRSSVGEFEVPYFGRKIKIAGDRTFADWQVNIMNDEDFGVRSMFETWSNALNRHVSNVRYPVLSREGYKADL